MAELRGGSTIAGYQALHSGLPEAYLGGNLTINGNIVTKGNTTIDGTITANGVIKSVGASAGYNVLEVNGKVALGYWTDRVFLGNTASPVTIASSDNPQVRVGSNAATTLWHSGNDGSGSGLDADLLDGLNSSSFLQLQSRTTGDFNTLRTAGVYGIGSGNPNTPGGSYGSLISAPNSDTGLQIYGGHTNDSLWFRGWSGTGSTFSTWRKVWHDGNSGTGSNLDADKVDGLHATSFMRTDVDDTFSGKHIASARRAGIYGTYSASLIDHVWSMGSAYMVDSGGANFGNLYGMAYKHTNNGTGGTMAGGHQIVFANAGSPGAAIGMAGNFWTSGSLTVGRSGVLMADASLKNTSTGRLDVAANLVSLNGGTVNIGEGIVNNTTMNVHGDSNFYGTGNTFDGTIWNNGGISGTGSIETQGSLTAGGNALVTQLIASAASAAVRFTGGGTQYHLEADSTGFNIVQTGVAGGQRLRVKNDGDIEAGNRLYVSKHYRSTVVSITSTGWYNIASNPGNRASARFKLMSTEGGGHQMTEIIASAAYNRQSESDISLLSRGGYATGDRIAAVRLLTGGTYDTMYIQVYIHANATMQFYMYDNDWESGWTPMHFTAGGIPAGYSATKMELHAGVKRANVFTSSSPPNAKGAYPGDIWIQY